MTIPSYPHGKSKPQLSDRQRWELAGASLTNAVALLDDAKTLLRAGRLQRSAFLFETCLEETLKGYLCLTREPTDGKSWEDFWETFRDHKLKLRLLREIEPRTDAEHDAGNRILRTWRERTVYVDVSQAGDHGRGWVSSIPANSLRTASRTSKDRSLGSWANSLNG